MMKQLPLIGVGIVVCVASGCLLTGEKVYPLPRVEPTVAAVVATSKVQEKWWADRHEQCKALAEKGGLDVMFIGDSITHGWEGQQAWARDFAPLKAGNFGFSGDRTENVLWRLENGEFPLTRKPKVAVLMIGTNNTGHRMDKPEAIAAGIGAIVDCIHARSPKTRILLLAIFPRGASPADAMRRNNDAVNALIARLDGYKNVRYLDINSKFTTPEGVLPADIMPDCLHPQAKGYAIWADAVSPELKKMLK